MWLTKGGSPKRLANSSVKRSQEGGRLHEGNHCRQAKLGHLKGRKQFGHCGEEVFGGRQKLD